MPTPTAMSKMHSCFQELLHVYDCQFASSFLSFCSSVPLIPKWSQPPAKPSAWHAISVQGRVWWIAISTISITQTCPRAKCRPSCAWGRYHVEGASDLSCSITKAFLAGSPNRKGLWSNDPIGRRSSPQSPFGRPPRSPKGPTSRLPHLLCPRTKNRALFDTTKLSGHRGGAWMREMQCEDNRLEQYRAKKDDASRAERFGQSIHQMALPNEKRAQSPAWARSTRRLRPRTRP